MPLVLSDIELPVISVAEKLKAMTRLLLGSSDDVRTKESARRHDLAVGGSAPRDLAGDESRWLVAARSCPLAGEDGCERLHDADEGRRLQVARQPGEEQQHAGHTRA